MRVTTQMLNNAARNAGLPVHRNTLLDYVNGSAGDSTGLLKALSNKTSKAAALTGKTSYEKLEESATALYDSAAKLISNEKDSLFANIKTDADKEKLYHNVKELLDNYNTTSKQLAFSDSPLNSYYCQMLGEAAKDSKQALETVGITFDSKGTAEIDRQKFMESDVADIEKVLGADSGFSNKIAFISEHISDNAKANLESLSNQYGKAGNAYASYLNSRYDYLG